MIKFFQVSYKILFYAHTAPSMAFLFVDFMTSNDQRILEQTMLTNNVIVCTRQLFNRFFCYLNFSIVFIKVQYKLQNN